MMEGIFGGVPDKYGRSTDQGPALLSPLHLGALGVVVPHKAAAEGTVETLHAWIGSKYQREQVLQVYILRIPSITNSNQTHRLRILDTSYKYFSKFGVLRGNKSVKFLSYSFINLLDMARDLSIGFRGVARRSGMSSLILRKLIIDALLAATECFHHLRFGAGHLQPRVRKYISMYTIKYYLNTFRDAESFIALVISAVR